jgi:hypothetical protein
MALPPFSLLLIDAAGPAALFVDGPSGEVFAEVPLPSGFAVVDLITSRTGQAFVAMTDQNGAGALCRIDLLKGTAETLSIDMPHPAQLVLADDSRTAYLADAAGVLHVLDFAATSRSTWDKPAGTMGCVGLAVSRDEVCGAWETAGGGLLATYSPSGALVRTCRLSGVPTGLIAGSGKLIIPFTASPLNGEGLFVFSQESVFPSEIITIQCLHCAVVHPAYPVQAVIARDGRTVYVACEGSASVAVIDIEAGLLTDNITIGRSVSRLALTADDRFAVASSNANADLCLLDLVNHRLVAVTAGDREILSPLAIID